MSGVPGTFKNRPPVPRRCSENAWARRVVTQLLSGGALGPSCYMMGQCSVIVAKEPNESGDYLWHLSVAHPTRYPTWDEIKTARYTLPELVDVPLMAQLLPLVESDDEWVNVHHNCFHLHEVVEAAQVREAVSTHSERTA